MTTIMDPVDELTREVRRLGSLMTSAQARGLVDLYYRWQEHRIALNAQIRAAKQGADEGTETIILQHFADQVRTLETQMIRVLDGWTDRIPVAAWAKQQKGIGPVLSAGLSAYIDITKAPTAGAIWRYAGLDPTQTWEKGEKRPWNAQLKVLCWKIGQSFMKQSGRDDAFYGQLYKQRKQLEVERNESGHYAQAAADVLAKRPRHAQAAIYREGKLPPGHLDARARRWLVKLFISHWHHVAWEHHYGEPPAKPYVITYLGHAHIIDPPDHICAVRASQTDDAP